MRVTTALDDELLLTGLTGEEGVSRPFRFQLDLLSENWAIAPEKVLRTPMTVTLRLPNGDERHIHGLVRRFAQRGQSQALTSYRAEIVPWLWFLSLSRECRIWSPSPELQPSSRSVPLIVEDVFHAHEFADFRRDLTKSYPAREYCVQYRETHLDFVSRLLEEEGIFYYFDHAAGKHELVLSDSNAASGTCPGMATARMAPQATAGGDDVVTGLHREHRTRVGKVALRDYDYRQPSLNLENVTGDERGEAYDYPGGYTQLEEGERYARLRLDAEASRAEVVRGEGTCRGFVSGYRFKLQEHYRSDLNKEYMLLQVQHRASMGDSRSGNDTALDYRNRFLAIPYSDTLAYHPSRVTRRPFVRGSQTALVVGPAGKEVDVDHLGRIKVQFYWDREGRKDGKGGHPVRVSQPWAGKGWGSVQIPRIGNEVIVEFMEGDPDRPIVTGCVYNAEQTPPFELPGAAVQMGMKSRSSPGGGGHNEISMTDTRGAELVNIHAQHDMTTTVRHDQSTTVQNDQTVTVKCGNRTLTVESGTSTETIKCDATLTVQDGARTVDVTGGDYSATSSDAIVLHGKGQGVSITGDGRGVVIKGNDKGVHVTGVGEGVVISGEDRGVGIKGKPTFFAEGTEYAGIKAPNVWIGDKEVTIQGTKITISAGASKIVLDAAGVTIEGPLVKIN